ncbi:uncharacterized protein JCM6883_003485 [Sporobolomyces salmoneus]|uniref:uncharacterized protein n=1 Tax=Sporobolomyces salmoneus TaxID=183962 RepID=UPI00317D9138
MHDSQADSRFSALLAASDPSKHPVDHLSTFQLLRSRLALVLGSNPWHWTIIALSSLEFAISFSEIIHDYLDASNSCHCTSTCEQSEIFEILDWASLTITSLFLLEIPLDLLAFGIAYYLPRGSPHWFLHLCDALVVIGAFLLTVSSGGPLESVVSLLIVLRLWRILKLVLSLEVGKEEFTESREKRENMKRKQRVGKRDIGRRK